MRAAVQGLLSALALLALVTSAPLASAGPGDEKDPPDSGGSGGGSEPSGNDGWRICIWVDASQVPPHVSVVVNCKK